MTPNSGSGASINVNRIKKMLVSRCQCSKILRRILVPMSHGTGRLQSTTQCITRSHTVCIVCKALEAGVEGQSQLSRRRSVRSWQAPCLPGVPMLNLESHLVTQGRLATWRTIRLSLAQLPRAKHAKLQEMDSTSSLAALLQCKASWTKTVNTDHLMIPAMSDFQQSLERQTAQKEKKISTTPPHG
jgi:hypothetical protein